ncbi:hypothetical protein PV327_000128 [Microctonus hyperodae]|uniref:NodB homology domain-containing protein n=1 Tax=Microctonus hyperodae TaxID=165561 RepID=A0AA39G6J4_MICHY|nr:hypothetical protein PV327_000128 [Microctonus hyperodae]
MKWAVGLFLILLIQNWVNGLNLAKPCSNKLCKLPNYKCSDSGSGNSIPISKIPQMVLLTFDDATTVITYDFFAKVLFNKKNPDGCPIGVTHLLSHEYTDYSKVNDLWMRGHEIALHSITHDATIEGYWRDINLTTFKAEFDGLRKMIINFAGIPKSEIRGIRLPFLQTSGNVSFQGIQELGLNYDTSLPVSHYVDPPLWPYTLEYASHETCQIEPCPTASFPNIWEVPMTMWLDEKNISCSMVDACASISKDAKPISEWLIKQFERHYNYSRAPFPVFMHAAWFLRNRENFRGFQLFIDYIQQLSDVPGVMAELTNSNTNRRAES